MSKNISETTKVTTDFKTIGILISFAVSLTTVYISLKSEIAVAMEEPKPIITQMEYDLKDELLRAAIMDTQGDVELILKKVEQLEQRIYELTAEKR